MIDARGYICPMPVVMVMQAAKENPADRLEVMVDNRCAVENVTRFGHSQGYQVSMEAKGDDFLLTLQR